MESLINTSLPNLRRSLGPEFDQWTDEKTERFQNILKKSKEGHHAMEEGAKQILGDANATKFANSKLSMAPPSTYPKPAPAAAICKEDTQEAGSVSTISIASTQIPVSRRLDRKVAKTTSASASQAPTVENPCTIDRKNAQVLPTISGPFLTMEEINREIERLHVQDTLDNGDENNKIAQLKSFDNLKTEVVKIDLTRKDIDVLCNSMASVEDQKAVAKKVLSDARARLIVSMTARPELSAQDTPVDDEEPWEPQSAYPSAFNNPQSTDSSWTNGTSSSMTVITPASLTVPKQQRRGAEIAKRKERVASQKKLKLDDVLDSQSNPSMSFNIEHYPDVLAMRNAMAGMALPTGSVVASRGPMPL